MPRTKKTEKEVEKKVEKLEEGRIQIKRESAWRKISRWSTVIGLTLMPIFFIPGLPEIASIAQQTLIGISFIIALSCLLVDEIRERRPLCLFPHPFIKSSFLLSVVGVSVSLFLSSSFSTDFWGGFGFEGTTGFSLLLAGIGFILGASLFRKSEDRVLVKKSFLIAASLAFLFVIILQGAILIFHTPLLGIENNVFNLFGGVSFMGIFSGVVLIAVASLLIFYEATSKQKLIKGGVIFLALLSLLTFGSAPLFFITALVLFLLLSLSQVFNGQQEEKLSAGGIALVLAIALLGFFMVTNYRIGNSLGVPAEITPSARTSFSVAIQSVSQNPISFLFGSGPNTYAEAFNLFKPIVINLSQFWNVDFPSGYSFWLTIMPTLGMAATIALFALCVMIGVVAFKRFRNRDKQEYKKEETVLGLMALSLFLSSLFFSLSFPLVIYFFFLLGLLFGTINTEEINVNRLNVLRLFISSFIMIGILVFTLIVGFLAIQRINGSIISAQAVRALSEKGDPGTVLEKLAVAYRTFPEENTARAMSTLWIQLLPSTLEATSSTDITPQTAFDNSVTMAKQAIILNPKNHQNWLLLGTLYQNVIPVDGAINQAISAYEEAAKTNPTNPTYPFALSQLRLLLSSSKDAAESKTLIKTAEENLQESIRLKPDLIDAYLLLGQVYQSQKRFEEAETVFIQALAINNQSIVVRYQLGKLYEAEGKTDAAEEQFKIIEETNPDNPNILESLKNQ